MKPLVLDDLLPLTEYAGRRQEFFDSHRKYVDRYRRVRIGPSVTLLFENRQTLWFRVQEIVRIARLVEAPLLQQELNLYNRLLPNQNSLQAAMIIQPSAADNVDEWSQIQGGHIRFHLGNVFYPAKLFTCRPEDRCVGMAHWVQFSLDVNGRRLLAALDQPAVFAFQSPFYQHESAPLTDDNRQSLIDDLQFSAIA